MPNVLLGIVGHFPFELEFDIGVVLPDESAGDENGEVGLSEDRQSSGRPGEMRQSGFLEEEAKKRENTRNVIARVHTKPIFLHPTAKNITVFVTGEILPPPSTPSPPSSASTLSVATAGDDIIPLTNTETPLASFVRSYLASTPLPLLLTHVRTPSSSTPKPISDLLALVTPLEFPIPPPDPPIHLIRSVTIEGMKVGTSKDGKTILASGTVRLVDRPVQLSLRVLKMVLGHDWGDYLDLLTFEILNAYSSFTLLSSLFPLTLAPFGFPPPSEQKLRSLKS